MLREALEAIERDERLDRLASPLRAAVRPAVEPTVVRNALSGTWIGHRLHPLLTDVAITGLVGGTLLDLLGGRRSEAAVDRLLELGVAAAVPTAASGLNDWVDLGGPDVRAARAGLVHAASNLTATALYAASLAARRGDRRGLGRVLSVAGLAAVGLGGYIGGHLSFRLGAGVDHSAFEHGPDDWTPTLALAELKQGEPRSVDANGRKVLLYRETPDHVLAIGDTCSHAGCSLAGGEIADGTVTCPCHGSVFRLDDGSVVRGPAAAPQPLLEARVQHGRVEVRLALG